MKIYQCLRKAPNMENKDWRQQMEKNQLKENKTMQNYLINIFREVRYCKRTKNRVL